MEDIVSGGGQRDVRGLFLGPDLELMKRDGIPVCRLVVVRWYLRGASRVD